MPQCRRRFSLFSLCRPCSTAAGRAQEAYPNKPVRMIVPFPPGGPADLIARVMAQKLSEDLGKQFYIENHAGAGGNIGVGVAARAPADGYSMLDQQPGHWSPTAASTPRSLPYDPDKDFVAVTRIATTPNVLVVHPSVPAKTVKELVELIRGSDPEKYHSYAQPGLGTPSHLSGELFRLTQNLKLTSVPFGGGGPMIQSVVAGHTPIAFSSLPPAAPHDPGRPPAGAGRHRRQAGRTSAGRADHGRGRLSRPDRRDADRHFRAGRHAGGDRRSPAPQGGGAGRDGRRQGKARGHRLLADRRHARGVRRLPQGPRTRSGAR